MLRKPTFGSTTYYIVSEIVAEGEHPQWLTEWPQEHVEKDRWEQWLEDVKGNVDTMPEFEREEFTVQNREYNKLHIYGRHFDNHDNFIVDEDCPECGHLLVEKENMVYEESDVDHDNGVFKRVGKFCSGCDYIDQALKDHHEADDARWKAIRETPPEPQFREAGQTLEEFAEKYSFGLDKKDPVCVSCKRNVGVSDFYRTKDYAFIIHGKGHAEDCENNHCPATIRPLGKQAEKWARLI